MCFNFGQTFFTTEIIQQRSSLLFTSSGHTHGQGHTNDAQLSHSLNSLRYCHERIICIMDQVKDNLDFFLHNAHHEQYDNTIVKATLKQVFMTSCSLAAHAHTHWVRSGSALGVWFLRGLPPHTLLSPASLPPRVLNLVALRPKPVAGAVVMRRKHSTVVWRVYAARFTGTAGVTGA